MVPSSNRSEGRLRESLLTASKGSRELGGLDPDAATAKPKAGGEAGQGCAGSGAGKEGAAAAMVRRWLPYLTWLGLYYILHISFRLPSMTIPV